MVKKIREILILKYWLTFLVTETSFGEFSRKKKRPERCPLKKTKKKLMLTKKLKLHV